MYLFDFITTNVLILICDKYMETSKGHCFVLKKWLFHEKIVTNGILGKLFIVYVYFTSQHEIFLQAIC
jgi:hypothetical protein